MLVMAHIPRRNVSQILDFQFCFVEGLDIRELKGFVSVSQSFPSCATRGKSFLKLAYHTEGGISRHGLSTSIPAASSVDPNKICFESTVFYRLCIWWMLLFRRFRLTFHQFLLFFLGIEPMAMALLVPCSTV